MRFLRNGSTSSVPPVSFNDWAGIWTQVLWVQTCHHPVCHTLYHIRAIGPQEKDGFRKWVIFLPKLIFFQVYNLFLDLTAIQNDIIPTIYFIAWNVYARWIHQEKCFVYGFTAEKPWRISQHCWKPASLVLFSLGFFSYKIEIPIPMKVLLPLRATR